jgi:hypothetical protein
MSDNEQLLDYNLIEPITIPHDSRVPGAHAGPDEYDRYFRIVRDRPGLLSWSRTCLDIQEQVLQDLACAELTAEERCELLQGFLIVQSVTLAKWVRAGEAARSASSVDLSHATSEELDAIDRDAQTD